MNAPLPSLQAAIDSNVDQAIAEDVGSGDITAELIAANTTATARLISRDAAVICGQPWVNAVFQRLAPDVTLHWQVEEGAEVAADSLLLQAEGNARQLLTAERCALNFLQTLSGTASRCRYYANQVKHTQVKLLDTRKTLPGLRLAQKYAVTQGGCFNHRLGLYDAFLIKENHIHACGSITAAVTQARHLHPNKPVEVEVENLAELDEALAANADTIMLDNFSLDNLRQAVTHTAGRSRLEASGGITDDTLVPIAETGVDFISIGALTKDLKAVDLSFRLL